MNRRKYFHLNEWQTAYPQIETYLTTIYGCKCVLDAKLYMRINKIDKMFIPWVNKTIFNNKHPIIPK